INAPPLPSRDRAEAEAPDAADGVVRTEKRYESQYCPPAQRARLVEALAARVRVATRTQAVGLRRDDRGWAVRIRSDGRDAELRCGGVVVAAGRFGPLLTAAAVPAPSHRPLRLEVGVRIEQPADAFFLRHDDRVDPKISWENAAEGVGWRTFCCCRDGLVATTRTHGVLTVSGRADCDATGQSNVGFNVRLTAPDAIAREWPPLRDRLTATAAPTSAPLAALLPGAAPDVAADALRRTLGDALSARLAEGLARLLADFPRAGLEEARVTGPALEGIGMYPQHDARLATTAPGLWVAGDCAGSFRGLTAALVSGHAAGRAAAEAVR
ncbi:MAG: FAD/NAD(P)-binding protein, partial [Naasia sp.]|nr:FAD/NAD(P)-binding protein [Naasia sp.]